MRKRLLAIALVLVSALVTGSIAAAAASIPQKSDVSLQVEGVLGLTGSQAELDAALKQSSAIRYKILVVDEAPADRTDYLDEVLDAWGWPAPDQLYLVIYPKANYDLRFAMGAKLTLNKVTVEEMVSLARSEYFTRSQKGDAAGGLAALIQAINKRME